jgi:hypothetical protein
MKKIILVLTAFLLAFSLFACDSGESEVSSTPIESSVVEASSVESSEPEISEPKSDAPESDATESDATESNAPESDAESSVPDFEQSEPLEIVMTTDKTEYTIDEKIVLTYVANDETAELNFCYYYVEYWDEEAKEWRVIPAVCTEEAYSCIGKGTHMFKLSERADAGYPKYRVKCSFWADRFFANKTKRCTIYSNEFTILTADN